MDIRKLTPFLSVSPQISESDLALASAQGFKSIISNRPDGEEVGQPSAAAMAEAAARNGLGFRHVPVVSGQVTQDNVAAFAAALNEMEGPVLAFCRTGTRSATLWALTQAGKHDADAILRTAKDAGYDLSGLRPRLGPADKPQAPAPASQHDVIIVGGGAGGLACAASLLKRRPGLDIAVIEPREEHYYQPGWTLVGGGVFNRARTEKPMRAVMPANVQWIRAAAAGFDPAHHQVVLEDGERLAYRVLIVSPGLKLDWDKVQGLRETLGKNAVTSNYLFDLAPYTWELVQNLKSGKAIFTQPPMPIKCAGAPQKAMYLSADHWRRTGRLGDIDIAFHNAGGVLFGVADYVPALMRYVERYGAELNFNSNLVAVDGPARKAWFEEKDAEGQANLVEVAFDMLHICPPQTPLDFVKNSPLADGAGWVEVNPETLQHVRFGNVFGMGDGCSAPNAKTAAAVRKQAPVVAENALAALDGKAPRAVYDGYGSCPLTVERGKVVLAEFGYGGKLLPTFPSWLLEGRRPTTFGWWLKAVFMPDIYWRVMLKGREWLARPTILPHSPTPHEAADACQTQPRK
ncbi:MAG: bifunctional protein tyrosine phosphatase family protein/NAD(P)/FAD-dependent oxidoreductase [Sphingomonadales bacterium]